MKVTATLLPEILLIEPQIFRDSRGLFMETYNEREMGHLGMPTCWKQDNYSFSHRNVIRGIHYQITQPQGKLVRVVQGSVLDVAIDLRKSSPTFGRHVAMELSAENGKMLWIPPGFGHGFMVLSETAGFTYKVTEYYSPQGERTILWSDLRLGIPWPVDRGEAIVSIKDSQGKYLEDAEIFE
jgi:dTDP-4-dehydrorhamnose 3,5-epimerase